MSGGKKKIPDEGTTAPDARPELRPNSGLFEPGPNSTVFDERAAEDAVLRAVSDHVLAQAETDPLSARPADPRSNPRGPVDIGPSGTDATHLNLESALDETRPTPMVSRQGIEPFDTTAPGALGGPAELNAVPARPKMAQTLTFVPELEAAQAQSPRRQRGVPKEESLLERIGQPAGQRGLGPKPTSARPGLFAFIGSSPVHLAAGIFAVLALLLLVTVVVVKIRQGPPAPIMSRPLEAPKPME